MEKNTQLRTKQTEVVNDLKNISGELNAIKGIITSGVVAKDILKADEALNANLDKLHTLCDFIIEFYNVTEPKAISDMKKELFHFREKNAEDQGTIFNLRKEVSDLRQEYEKYKVRAEKADSTLDAFRDPEGLVNSMDTFYEIIKDNEELAREFFELDDVSEEDKLHKNVRYSTKFLENVLVKGIDYAQKLKEYIKDLDETTRKATGEKVRADSLSCELEDKIDMLNKLQDRFEAMQKDYQKTSQQTAEIEKQKDTLEKELEEIKAKSEKDSATFEAVKQDLSNELNAEIKEKEIVQGFLERLGYAYNALREIIPKEIMDEIDTAVKNNEEGIEELVQELVLGAVVSKEEMDAAKKKYSMIKDAFTAILGENVMKEYEGLTEEQNPYLWLMQTHQDNYVEKVKSDEKLEAAAKDLQSAIQEYLALEQGIIHAISLVTDKADTEKIKANIVNYLKENIEGIKQEREKYKEESGQLKNQLTEKDAIFAEQKSSYDSQVKALESRLQEKNDDLAEQKSNYDAQVQELEGKLVEKTTALTVQKQDYSGKIQALEEQLNEASAKCSNYEENIGEKEREIAGLKDELEQIEAKEKTRERMADAPEEVDAGVLLIDAGVQYMLALDYIKEGANSIAKTYLDVAISLCGDAFKNAAEEEKQDIHEKIKQYQDRLAKLEQRDYIKNKEQKDASVREDASARDDDRNG